MTGEDDTGEPTEPAEPEAAGARPSPLRPAGPAVAALELPWNRLVARPPKPG